MLKELIQVIEALLLGSHLVKYFWFHFNFECSLFYSILILWPDSTHCLVILPGIILRLLRLLKSPPTVLYSCFHLLFLQN